MIAGETILAVIHFIEYPTWHLVVLFVILLLILAWYMVKQWPGVL